ncbi:MAG: DUF333 domain-containing protein [Patescibacteria group bacterium]|jgi:putative hemolysin
MKKSYILIAIVVLLVLAGALLFIRGSEDTWICVSGEWVKHGHPDASQPTTPCPGATADQNTNIDTNTNAGLANPASVYCKDHGGNSQIVTADDGSQSGVCVFADGSKCDEWAYFRGECQKSQRAKTEVTCVETPCGPTPEGGNSCGTNPPSTVTYQTCTADSDCSAGKTCQAVNCFSGDAGVNYHVCK